MIFIARHKTALKRQRISRPVRIAIEEGLINQNTSVFDYGCGQGDDIKNLKKYGIKCFGWDPVYSPQTPKIPADIVNLGYVVNVIESPIERAQTLKEAWQLTNKILIVSARLITEERANSQTKFEDGYLTRIGTFQKFFDQSELKQWIDNTLENSSIAAAPGIFYVFRDQSLRESVIASRYRGVSTRQYKSPEKKSEVFESNKSFFEDLIAFLNLRGRLPSIEELPLSEEVSKSIKNIKRAFDVLCHVIGSEQWDEIREERSEDLLIYLALSRFGGRPRFSELPSEMQLDVRAFFSTYQAACDRADQLLFTAGKMDLINASCRKSPTGKLTPNALYVHKSALQNLPAILRIYEGCARAYIGAVDGANLIKLSRVYPQVSYLYYPDFENDPHPSLASSLLVPLDTFHIKYRDYQNSDNPPILHRKETFLAKDHPLRNKFMALTKREEKLGLYENPELIGTKEGWNKILNSKSVIIKGHKITKKTIS